jgi:FkbM family methyltransferase
VAGRGNIGRTKMNRRITTLGYWLTRKNPVGVVNLVKFLCKPRMPTIAARYISRIEEKNGYLQVWLKGMDDCLFWPKEFDLYLLQAMIAEICDETNWHCYFDPRTPIGPEDTVIDVGAAEGLFSLLALQRGARVVAIEPNPAFAAAMQGTLGRFMPEKAKIFHAAAGDSEAEVDAPLEPLVASVSTVLPGHEGNVRMQTLDRLLCDLDHVTFIKADIEGMEMQMLKGASGLIRRFRPKLVITCYHEANDYREMVRFVQGLVPEYRFALSGITHFGGKPVLVRFWIPGRDDA